MPLSQGPQLCEGELLAVVLPWQEVLPGSGVTCLSWGIWKVQAGNQRAGQHEASQPHPGGPQKEMEAQGEVMTVLGKRISVLMEPRVSGETEIH